MIKFYSSSNNNKSSPSLSIIPNYLIYLYFYGGVSIISSDNDSLIYFLGCIILSISSISSTFKSSKGYITSTYSDS